MSDTRIFGGGEAAVRPARPLGQALWRGWRGRCPACGEGRLFSSFLKTVDRCDRCGEAIHHHRADDLPAYLAIFAVGHIVVGAFMGVEAAVELSTVQHLAIWIPLTLVATLAVIGPIKGAVVGLQWANYMHGFGGGDEPLEQHPEL